jgi:hypothetical protein
VKHALACALACAARVAAAQPMVPVYPQQGAPQAPVNLDPGETGSQAKPVEPPRQPAQQQPNVVVVKPDGTVTYGAGDQGQGPSGYYIGGGDTGAVANEPQTVHVGPIPELHVVRKGDTLWDICFYYFNDPWQWPKVWSYNPQITNPHWIYPGDLVRLLPHGVFAEQPGVGEPEEPQPKKADGGATKPSQTLPAPQRRVDVGIKQTAFVEKSDLDKSITIDGAVDEKELLGVGDEVYLSYSESKPPELGKTYSIYKPDNDVKSGKDTVGAYVHVLGALKVTSVRQDKRARGRILESNQEIERGQKVGPLLRQFKTVPPVPPKTDAQGQIVAMLKSDQLIGQGEVVFVALGKGDGLEVGNRMYVVRRGDAKPANMDPAVGQNNPQFPARSIGEIMIVEVGERISIGLVTLSVQEMGVGDFVLMQKPK